MTKDESTYLSFLHCLLRAVPGLGNFLHATGTDNESALRNLEDMRERMAMYVVHELGLGEEPYLQNIPEAMNTMLKQWNKFIPQELDRFVVSLYDFKNLRKCIHCIHCRVSCQAK